MAMVKISQVHEDFWIERAHDTEDTRTARFIFCQEMRGVSVQFDANVYGYEVVPDEAYSADELRAMVAAAEAAVRSHFNTATPGTMIGTICHSDDNASDPNHRRVEIYIGDDGYIWGDRDEPHRVEGLEKPTDLDDALCMAEKHWSGQDWDFRPCL